MISYLSIKNFGLFADVRLELEGGLTVFTGETGAGKSMIVDAVMACLGQRTPKELIRTGEGRASVELLATLPEGLEGSEEELWAAGEVVLQKDILPDRSYLRVNGRLATSSMVQELGDRLVDICGQQEHHSLLRPQAYLDVLDSLRKDAIELRASFSRLYRQVQDLRSRIAELDSKDRERDIDILSFQVDEIEKAKLRPGEEEELRREYVLLTSQERIQELASAAYEALYDGTRSATEDIDLALSQLRRIQSLDAGIGQALEALQEVSFGLESAVDLLREYRKRLRADPDRLRAVSERLDLIQKLKSKYGDSVEKIAAFAASARARLQELLNADETVSRLRSEEQKLKKSMEAIGDSLTRARSEAARAMEADVTGTLAHLGMPGGQFVVRLERDAEPGPSGFDRVTFLFSANPGEPPLPVNKVASGGELSRLMLAIKSHMEAADPVPTMVFDEIDAGVGGRAGQAVAEKLWSLGRRHQVLCVTHLASIAALADCHYLVYKEERDGRTYASVRLLEGEERVAEIARMLSGRDLDISLEHARELIRASEEYKKSHASSTSNCQK